MSGPLSGVRIVELAVGAAAPWATAILASQGAEVIKVERPGGGDLMRANGPHINGVPACFWTWNHGKRSICVDLKQAEGVEVVRKLAATADIFVHNLRPGAAEEMGLGYEDLRAIKPDLIHAILTGWGERGPQAGNPAYDSMIQAATGLIAQQADRATGEMRIIGGGLVDKVSALTLSQLLTAALFSRARTGQGQRLHVSMLHLALAFIWPDGPQGQHFLDRGEIRGLVRIPPVRKTADGWMCVSMNQDAEFKRACHALGADDLMRDPRFANAVGRAENQDTLEAEMGALMVKFSSAELSARFTENRIPHSVVKTVFDAPEDPQVVANDLFDIVDDPRAGRIRTPRPVGDFTGTPLESVSPAPQLGEHTDELLRSIGLNDESIGALRASGVVA